MNPNLFEDLVQSLKEAKAIAKGEAPASRRIMVNGPMSKLCGNRSVCRKANLPV